MDSKMSVVQIAASIFIAAGAFGINGAQASELLSPKINSPERTALLDALRVTDPMKESAKEWKVPKVTFFDVSNWEKDDWAYVRARPGTLDQKHTTEPVQGVEHKVGGKWKWIDWVSDEIAPAEDPDGAFKKWHEEFCKTHKGCPSEIFPKKF